MHLNMWIHIMVVNTKGVYYETCDKQTFTDYSHYPPCSIYSRQRMLIRRECIHPTGGFTWSYGCIPITHLARELGYYHR